MADDFESSQSNERDIVSRLLRRNILLICAGLAMIKRAAGWSGDRIRQVIGAGIVMAAAAIWFGLGTSLHTSGSMASPTRVEQTNLDTLEKEPAVIMQSAQAAPVPTVSGPLAALLTTRQWLNTPPLQAADLAGKVVLVNFWTYSCINCLRVLPYVRAWAQKYADRGLVVVGVHTPEFAFEKNPENVRKALKALAISYPVDVDNNFGIWRAFRNQGWPGLYFVGADGRLAHSVVGEGDYERSERVIQKLLADVATMPAPVPVAPITGQGAQAEADARNLRSGETYIGYAQSRGFASPSGLHQDVPVLYRAASSLGINRWSLSGIWTVGGEFATMPEAGGRITYRFHARDLHLVLASASPGLPIRFRVTLDGQPPGDDHGADVDAQGWGSVQDGRLYQLIRQSGSVTDRLFEIEFLSPGVRAYAFTFG